LIVLISMTGITDTSW